MYTTLECQHDMHISILNTKLQFIFIKKTEV